MRKVAIFLLFMVLLVSMSQAVIVKFEAEDPRVYYVPGDNWTTVADENASGGAYITAIETGGGQPGGDPVTEENIRYYSFSMPAGTYVLYVRLSIDNAVNTTQGAADNDSFHLSNNSLSEDADLIDFNGIDQTSICDESTLNNFSWVPVHVSYDAGTVRTYVMEADGTAYFKIAPREDGLYIDAFAFVTQGEEVTCELLDSVITGTEPYDPSVTPVWNDGSVGTPISDTVCEVTLHFKAAGDPNQLNESPFPVNLDIVGHYIYLSSAGDPNVSLYDYVPQIHNPNPYLTDPNISFGPVELTRGIVYNWQVEEAMDDGTGSPRGAGDPNNVFGPLWTFTTISTKPAIVVDPENLLTDFAGNGSFSAAAGPEPVATHYRWYKVGAPDVELDEGELNPDKTTTLTITGATQADEGRYYCIAYNGDPDAGGIASDPSATARLWYPRLVSHYPFEAVVADTTPDIESSFDMDLLSDDGGTDLPVLAAGVPELAPDTSALSFDNSSSGDPNYWAQYALAEVGAGDYQDITISVWVSWSGGDNWQRILDFGNNTNEYIFLTPMADGGGLRFAVNNAGEQSIDTGVPLPIGEWTYVTATLSGNTARLYVNGQLETTGTITHDPVDFSPTLNYVGKSQWPDPYFNGLLDDLKIYNYARTTEQIAQDYLAVKGDWVCNNELYDLPYDFDGDCQIGLGDLAMFIGEEWMGNYRIYPIE